MATNNSSCEPCLRGNVELEGYSWCSDCEEVLCLACDRAHGTNKLTLSHRTTELQELPSAPTCISMNVSVCEKHSENHLDGYCTFHDTTCCRTCILEDHRTCENIKTVGEVASQIKSSVLVDNVSKSLPALLSTLATISDNRKNNQKTIGQQEIDIKSSIAKLKGEVLNYLDSLEKSLNVELTKLKDETALKCETQHKETEDMSVHFLKLKDELELILEYGSNRKIFLFVEKLKQELTQRESKVHKLLSELKNVDLEFKTKNDLPGIISSLGSIEVKTKGCIISHSSLIKSKAQLSLPRLTLNPIEPISLTSLGKCSISGIEITKDGNIILCDCEKKRVLLCTNEGCIIKRKHIPGRPYQITSISGEEVAITNYDAPKISILCTDNLNTNKQLNLQKIYCGITFLKNTLLVGGVNEIDVLSMNGHICRTIPVFSDSVHIRYIYSNNDYTLLCSSASNVLLVNILDGHKSKYYGSTTEPRGIAEDRFGNIFIADKSQRNIHRISSNGDPMKFPLIDTSSEPLAIRFSRDHSKLYVGYENYSRVEIYACK